MFQPTAAQRFGRIRLERDVSSELLRILYEERARCLTKKSNPLTPEDEKEECRFRLRAISRVWKETSRMMDELEWERPNGECTLPAME